jgi:predicted SprT family Zn-dependent metalloprotease
MSFTGCIAMTRKVWMDEARDQVFDAMLKCNCDFKTLLPVVWNHRLSSTAGRYLVKKKVIELSLKIWPRMTPEDRRQTTLHEAAHAISHFRVRPHAVLPAGTNRRIKPHGREWQRVMHELGVPARVRHNYNVEGLSGRQRRWPVSCGCQDIEFTTTRINNMRRGKAYRCRRCARPFREVA